MAVGAVVARILTQYSDKGSKQAQKDIAKLQKRIDASAKKIAKSFAVAAAASGALAVKIGVDAVEAAIQEQKTAAVLANTLRNVAGATDATIKSVEQYIDKQEMLSTVSDDELRASLGRLVSVTGDVTKAMDIQTVALDVAAGTTKDLSVVSAAFEKAAAGNFTALKKLLPGIDANIIKNKDLGKALLYANKQFSGAAKAYGDTNPLQRLRIAYTRVLETLGTALLPVVIEFTEYITKPGGVLDTIDEWVKANDVKLQDSLNGLLSVFKLLVDNGDNLTKTLNVLVTISNFLNSSIFGVIKWGEALLSLFVAGRLLGAVTRIFGGLNKEVLTTGKRFDVVATKGGLTVKVLKWFIDKGKAITGIIYAIATAFTTLGIRAGIAAIGVALATAGANIYAALPALLAVGVTAFATKRFMDSLKDSTDGATKALENYGSVKRQAIAGPAKLAKEEEARLKRIAAITAANAAAEKKAALEKARLEAALARVRKALNAKGEIALDKETDVKQLNAAEALLKRQKTIDAADLDRLNRLKQEIIAMGVRNDLAKRYQDILTALADQKIDPKEIIILAKMWGVPTEAVEAYLATIFAVEDATITDDEIVNLAMKWGSTQAQAAQYLDFFQALNDGQLSDAEINKLMSKWKLTQDEVLLYADFVGIVNDGKLEDAEIIKIQGKWKLTVDQVVDYIKKIGAPVSYSGTLIDPARAAEIGWLNATAALQRYLDLLKKGTGVVVPGNAPGGFVPGSGNDPAVIAAATASAEAAAAAAIDAANALAESEEALAASIAALESATSLGAIRTATTTEEINKAVTLAQVMGESASDIANAMMTGLLGQGMDAANAASSARYTGQAIAEMQRQQQAAADAAAARARALDAARLVKREDYYDYRTGTDLGGDGFRGAFNSSGTVATASGISGGNLMAAPIVNITVQGSVTSENDLVQTVRNGLLAGQYNGNSINIQAI